MHWGRRSCSSSTAGRRCSSRTTEASPGRARCGPRPGTGRGRGRESRRCPARDAKPALGLPRRRRLLALPRRRPARDRRRRLGIAGDGARVRDEAVGLLRDLIRVDTSNRPGARPRALVLQEFLEANGSSASRGQRSRPRGISSRGSRVGRRPRSRSSYTPTWYRPMRGDWRHRPSPATWTRTVTCGGARQST